MIVCHPSLIRVTLENCKVTLSPLICTVGMLLILILTLLGTICGLASTTKVTVVDCSSSPAPSLMVMMLGLTI